MEKVNDFRFSIFYFRFGKILIGFSYCFLSVVCSSQPSTVIHQPSTNTRFKDVTQPSGINHQFQVYEGFLGGGACVLDINNDGYDDIFLAGGMGDDQLYLNNKNGTFTNIYEKSGLTGTKEYMTQAAVAADVNRDGFVDLYITTITSKGEKQIIPRAPNLLYLNNGDNTFRDATKEFGLDQFNSFSTGACFGDFNADGFPDLYVGNYFTEYPGNLSTINDNMIVSANQITEGYLFLNERGKKFRNVYSEYALTHKGFGFGGVFTDYNNDGYQDLFVNHDFGYKRTPDLLLKNNYPWKSFKDVSKETKMDLKINSMASAVGDYNNDGFMDYFVTNIRFNKFMVNQGIGKPFKEMSKELGLDFVTISWGANFADFDNDGDLDLFVANGDLNPNCVPMADYYFENIKSYQPSALSNQQKWLKADSLKLIANFRFEEKARTYGVNDYGIGRGSVVFDFDNDGDLDILVVNQQPVLPGYPVNSMTHLYRNDSAKGNWTKIYLKGVDAETHGLGSKVEIVVNGQHQYREIDGGGSSHLSQNGTYAHFGLGDAIQIDEIIVHWTGGNVQVLKNQKANQVITITEVKSFHLHPFLKWALMCFGGIFILSLGYYFFGWRR